MALPDGRNLIYSDCAVVPDELPNFPHIEVDQVKHYVVAKFKEAVLSFVDR